MKITYISIFPGIFDSFLATSLIQKAQDREYLEFFSIDPRTFTNDKHQQVDDDIYGGWQGMLIKAQPVIESIKSAMNEDKEKTIIVMVTPGKKIFNQKVAYAASQQYKHIIFVCGRYEGIDHRVELWCKKNYPDNFEKRSLGQFVTLWGEVPSMVMTEAIVRLLPWVIKEENSRKDESYSPEKGMENIEYPQYTRPLEVEGMSIPDVLLSWHHKNIEKWKEDNQWTMNNK